MKHQNRSCTAHNSVISIADPLTPVCEKAAEGKSVGENSDVAASMDAAELDHFFFRWAGVLLRVTEHMLFGAGRIHPVGFDGWSTHLKKNNQAHRAISYDTLKKIFPLDTRFERAKKSRRSGRVHLTFSPLARPSMISVLKSPLFSTAQLTCRHRSEIRMFPELTQSAVFSGSDRRNFASPACAILAHSGTPSPTLSN